MNSEFDKEFADLIEVETEALGVDYLLEESGMWDSMTVVSTIALIDEFYGKTVEGDALQDCKTYGDIGALIEKS